MSTKDKSSHAGGPIFTGPAEVARVRKLSAPGYFSLALRQPYIASKARPGQFVNLRCGGGTFLLRPISISGVKGPHVELVFRAVGRGTEALSLSKPGDLINVTGPLGNDFTLSKSHPVLVAGGSGVASLAYLAARLKPGVLLYGARNRSELLGLDAFKKWKKILATEDGSAGAKGFITCALDTYLAGRGAAETCIYACGPRGMLKSVAAIASKYSVRCQVSIEDVMACGVGACRGCIIETKTGNKSICKEGPVFDAGDILWEKLK